VRGAKGFSGSEHRDALEQITLPLRVGADVNV
jgi:hypothetical protein